MAINSFSYFTFSSSTTISKLSKDINGINKCRFTKFYRDHLLKLSCDANRYVHTMSTATTPLFTLPGHWMCNKITKQFIYQVPYNGQVYWHSITLFFIYIRSFLYQSVFTQCSSIRWQIAAWFYTKINK